MTDNDQGRRPPGPPPTSFSSAFGPVPVSSETREAPATEVVAVESAVTSGNGVASAVFGSLALFLALLMMANGWGNLFIPTAVLGALSLLAASSSISDVKRGIARGRFGQAGITFTLLAVLVWFFKIDAGPLVAGVLGFMTEQTPVWPATPPEKVELVDLIG